MGLVHKGQNLTEGGADPHEILEILGPSAVQDYLIAEIQKVYRLQGVEINDKHIEVIISQMLKKVRITDPGDSDFFWGEQVDRFMFMSANDHIEEAGGMLLKVNPFSSVSPKRRLRQSPSSPLHPSKKPHVS